MKPELRRAFPAIGRELMMLSLAMSTLAVVVSLASAYRRPLAAPIDAMTATARVPLVMIGGKVQPIADADYALFTGGVKTGGVNQIAITPSAFATGTPSYDDYNPGGVWPAASLLLLRAGDNEGTRLTGLLATGVTANDRKTICNVTASGVDDAVIVLQYETTSTAANRFWTPDQTDVTIPKYGCVDITYDGADSRWLVLAPITRMTRAAIQSLAIPCDALAPVLASGTTNNWEPTFTNVQNTTAASGAGYAGCSLAWEESTYVKVLTNAAGSSLSGMAYTRNGNADPAGLNPVKMLVNFGATGALTLLHKNGGSSGTNQFDLPAGASVVLAVGEGVTLVHDTSGYWHTVGVGHVNITAGTSLALAATGAMSLNMTATSCSAGSTVTAISGTTGSGTCSVFVNAGGTNTTLTGSSLAVAAAPVFTSVVTMALEAVGPALTPAALTSGAQTDNWSPTNFASNTWVRAQESSTTTATLSGMVGPGAGTNPGLRKILCNFGNGPISTLNLNASSSAGNKFLIPTTLSTSPTYSIPVYGCAEFIYDSNGYWMPLSQGIDSHETSIGVVPTLTSCGTGSPTIVGTDTTGTITEGTTASGCVLTFAAAWDTYMDVPTCNVNAMNVNPLVLTYTVSRTALTITNTSATGDVLAYHCVQTKN